MSNNNSGSFGTESVNSSILHNVAPFRGEEEAEGNRSDILML